ncbi:MAG: PQQ-dependent sugar dehydrogenase [Gemmatimonadetes bacterium]|nr:PQQ-dependent sugar dehydrogenase [Gemmatimonadota bacterium]
MTRTGPEVRAAATPVPRVTWVLASLGAVVFLPAWFYLGVAPASLSPLELPLVFAMGLGYLLAVVLSLAVPGRIWVPLWAGPAGFAVGYGLLLLVPGLQSSRAVVLLSAVLGTGFLLLDRVVGPRVRFAASALVAAMVVSSVVVDGAGPSGAGGAPVRVEDSEVRLTGLHGLRVTTFSVPDLAGRTGGGLVRADSVLVVVDGAGDLGILHPDAPEGWRRIEVGTPMDIEPMRAAAGRDDHAARMRVMDLAVRRDEAGWELYLSHHVFHGEEMCFIVRLSRVRLDPALAAARDGETWETVFETDPCVPYLQGDRQEPFFRGNDSGGRLAWLEPGVLLLTVGDHMLPALAGDASSDYGKTIRIDLRDGGGARHFTSGHRNPQGITVADGVVWATEHGPQGGDELNRLVDGADYGWAWTTLGTDYGAFTFTPDDSAPPEPGAREPLHVWMPSLGVSDVVVVEGRGFHRWRGDLLIASLKAGHLRRVRMRDGRVVYDEPIDLGHRIRAIVEDARGAIWLRTDGPEVLRLEVDDAGAEAWSACVQCHALVEDPTLRGPHLGGVEGRPVASVAGFEYSPGLRAVRGRWTRARLDAFLSDPHAFAPGTAKAMEPVTDPEVRRRILDHLRAAGGY